MVGLRQERLHEGGGNCLKFLKKRGGEIRILKGGQARSRGECLKKGGWNPLTNEGLPVALE